MNDSVKQPYFSIVMPAYQAEQYLCRAIEGIQEQTFRDWELLIVNDCSKDATPVIAEEHAREDARIRVIHQPENRGVSEARNRGLQEAKGKYLWFVDADDEADRHLLDTVWKTLEQQPAQLVIFGLLEEYYSGEGRLEYTNPRAPKEAHLTEQTLVRKEFLSLEQQTLYGYPWNKIYDLAYLRKLGLKFLDYRENKFVEDILFNIEYCMDIDSLHLLPITPYHYAKRSNESLTNEFVKDYYILHRRRIEALWNQQKYWNQDSPETRSVLGSLYSRYILSALTRNCDKKSEMTGRDRREFCKKIFADKLFEELVTYGKASDSTALKIALAIMKTKNVTCNLAFARMIYLVKTKLPLVFSRVKSGR